MFLILDSDHDGAITEAEFCAFGAKVGPFVTHYLDLANRFSAQLVNSTCECTRYGAFFVMSGARADSAPSYTPDPDAVIFVYATSSHAAPAWAAALTNARLARLGRGKQVTVRVHPFLQTRLEQATMEQLAVFMLAIYITFSLSFIPGDIAHHVVKDRHTGTRQLQILSGASHLSYWIANLASDAVRYLMPALSVPLAFHQFGFNMLLVGECGLAIAAVLPAFGPALQAR